MAVRKENLKKIRKNITAPDKKRNKLRNDDLSYVYVPWVGGGGWWYVYVKENPKNRNHAMLQGRC